MKNKLFSKNLYIEGLSQLKTVGIVSGSIFVVSTLLILLSETAKQYSYYDAAVANFKISFVETTPFIYIIPYIVTPILMFRLFSFMFKRNRSDFYHSIPQTRSCIYLSFTLSALTYVVLQMLICSLVGVLGFLITGFRIIDFLTFFSAIPNLFAVACLIASTILIAISVTGRLFSALTVAIMILFYPRIFYLIFSGVITSTVTVIDGTHFLPYSLLKYNAFFTFDYSILTFIYTFGLALILGAFGLFLFKKKKSQTASYPTASKRAQSIIRISFSMLLFVVGISMVYDKVFEKYNFRLTSDDYDYNYNNAFSIVSIIIVFVIALMAYFVYDIISNRSAKGILKAVKDLIYLGIVNVLIFAILAATTFVVISYNPKVENIESVTILSCSDYDINNNYDGVSENEPLTIIAQYLLGTYDMSSDEEYEDDNRHVDLGSYEQFCESVGVKNLFNGILNEKITNKKAIKVICDSYNTAETYGESKILKCKINEKGKTYYRDVAFDQKELDKLANSFEYDSKHLASKLEKISQNVSRVYFWDEFSADNILNKDAKKEILAAAKEDIKNFKKEDFAKLYLENLKDEFDEGDCFYADFGVGVKTNDGKYYAFCVCPFMPKTVDVIVNYYNKTYKGKNDKEQLKDFLKSLKEENAQCFDFDEYDFSDFKSVPAYTMDVFDSCSTNVKMISKTGQKQFYNEIIKRGIDVTKRNSDDDVVAFVEYSPANNKDVSFDQAIYIPKDIYQKYIEEYVDEEE